MSVREQSMLCLHMVAPLSRRTVLPRRTGKVEKRRIHGVFAHTPLPKNG